MRNIIKNKKANILTENIIFIILNLVFLLILIVFLFSKTGSPAVLEEKYSKQIALAIDSAEAGMVIHLNMEDAIKTAAKEGINTNNIISIQENVVTIKLREKGGYSYSFFNNVDVNSYPDTTNNKEYVFFIYENE
ncbi:MAG: hypothetical protein ABIH65_02160 [Nanoarchaeota archaeon]